MTLGALFTRSLLLFAIGGVMMGFSSVRKPTEERRARGPLATRRLVAILQPHATQPARSRAASL